MVDTKTCSATGCERDAEAVIDSQGLCLTHFLTTCYHKLEILNRNSRNWQFGGEGSDDPHRLTNEISEQATQISEKAPRLTNLERAQLKQVLLQATDVKKRLRRSPRHPMNIPIRLISEVAGRSWEEETHTVIVSRYGAHTTCRHEVQTGDFLKVLRADTGEQAEARVIWERQGTFGGREIAFGITNNENFWRLDWSPVNPRQLL